MASIVSLLLISTTILPHLLLCSSLRDQSVHNAAEILSNSGYISMSLTLQLVSEFLVSNVSTATVFSPPDEAFSEFGQPSFALLRLHFSPVAYSFSKLQSLSFGSAIPTLSPRRSLHVTTLPTDDRISIDYVNINGSPIYDDGILVVFATDKFFDLNFEFWTPPITPIDWVSPSPSSSSLECPAHLSAGRFSNSARMLRSRGYSIMASFLDLQLVHFSSGDYGQFTVFAPMDRPMIGHIGNYSNWRFLFLHHVVPCKLSFSQLAGLDDGSVLSTFLGEGFVVHVSRSGDTLLLNGVPIEFPDLYDGRGVVVHGIQDVLVMADEYRGETSVADPPGNDEVIMDEF